MALEFSFSYISKFFNNTKEDENSFFDGTTKKLTNSIEERRNEFIVFINELKNKEYLFEIIEDYSMYLSKQKENKEIPNQLNNEFDNMFK